MSKPVVMRPPTITRISPQRWVPLSISLFWQLLQTINARYFQLFGRLLAKDSSGRSGNLSQPHKTCFSRRDVQVRSLPSSTQVNLCSFRTIYNVCCQRHNVTLYNDVLKLIDIHLQRLREGLLSTSSYSFLEIFAQLFLSYQQASQILCICFKYLVTTFSPRS